MKIRTGFVSNSSSSSFLIAVKDISKSSALAYIQNACDDESRSNGGNKLTILKSEADIRRAIEDMGAENIDEFKIAIMLAGKGWKKKYTIVDLTISYHDEELNSFVKNNEDVQVLYEENY